MSVNRGSFVSPPREPSSGIGGCFVVTAMMLGAVVLVMAVVVAISSRDTIINMKDDSGTKGGGGSSTKGSTSSNTRSSTSSSSNTKRSTSSGSGNGNDPPKKKAKLPKEHYDSELDTSKDTPITGFLLGPNGRVQWLKAKIKKSHVKPKGQERRRIADRVTRFVKSMGQVKSPYEALGNDVRGHLVGDQFSGPHDRTYNFIPMSPQCNKDYLKYVEMPIRNYLDRSLSDDAYVELYVEMDYVDYLADLSPDRPRMVKVRVMYSDGKVEEFEISNL